MRCFLSLTVLKHASYKVSPIRVMRYSAHFRSIDHQIPRTRIWERRHLRDAYCCYLEGLRRGLANLSSPLLSGELRTRELPIICVSQCHVGIKYVLHMDTEPTLHHSSYRALPTIAFRTASASYVRYPCFYFSMTSAKLTKERSHVGSTRPV